MTTTTYRLATAPRHAAMYAHDCARCGREEIRPVFLEGGDGVRAYGAGCAATLLGIAPAKVRREAVAVQHADDTEHALALERAAHAAAILAEDDEFGPLYLAKKGEVLRYIGGPRAGFLPAFRAALEATAADGSTTVAERVAAILAAA